MTVAGVIIIGIVCSAIYDALVKPGFNMVSKVFFDVITFGSQSVRDYAFSNAALDPTALPSMIVFTIVLGLIGGVVVSLNLRLQRSRRKLLRPISSSETEGDNVSADQIHHHAGLKQTSRPSMWVVWLIDGLMIGSMFVVLTVLNQSLLVWRVHNANTHIIAPYLSQGEMLKIDSLFSQVKTEKDYKNIYNMMSAVAVKNKVELRAEETW